MGFQDQGDVILIAGSADSIQGLAGSEFVRMTGQIVAGKPAIEMDIEVLLQRFLFDAAAAGLAKSAHDVGVGGIAVAIAECCIAGNAGAEIAGTDAGAALFAETQSRAVVSCHRGRLRALLELAERHGVNCHERGAVAGERLRFGSIDLHVDDLREAYESGLPRALEGVTANA
jgi:phosphoribosylformylglycinamidine synthase